MILRLGILATAALAPQRLFSRLHDVGPYRAVLRDWIAGLALEPGASIVEIGCGPGRLSLDLRADGFQVSGVDRSSRMIRAARRNGLDRTLLADALHLPCPDGSFEAAISASLINVVDDAPGLLAEMVRVTRPGGTVSCLFPAPALRNLDPRTLQFSSTLGVLDLELLKTWARVSRKLEAQMVLGWMRDLGVRDLTVQSFWGGGVAAVAGRTGLPEKADGLVPRRQGV